MKIFKSVILPIVGRGLSVLLLMMGCISCNLVFSDRNECPSGVSLRFVYDYNMEYADAFNSKVHCVRVYVFDETGAHVGTFEEQGDALKNESWRMPLALPMGNYTLIAYGGLACEESSFEASLPVRSSIEELGVELKHDNFFSDKSLHGLYYGTTEIAVDEWENYVEGTIYLKKNTNNIRIILQQDDDNEISPDDFTFRITDDNSAMDMENNVVSKGTVTYGAWTSGKVAMGVNTATGQIASAAYAELSTSRLVKENDPKLIVTRNSDGKEIVNISLLQYLFLMRSDLYATMPAQEFLDRQSEWSILFVSADSRWIDLTIHVNGWRVNINETEF